MSSWDLLGSFAARWQLLAHRLPPSVRRELGVLLAGLRTEGAAREELAERAVRLVLAALPEEEAARLRPDPDPSRLSGPPDAVAAGFDALDLCMLVVDGNPMVGPLLGPVRERLLSAPSLSAQQVAAGGADPAHGRLIALSDARGRRRYPAFQFTAGGAPRELVVRVNGLLGAAEDPWGSADWWLSDHPWWGEPPAALLGTGREAALWAAAAAAGGAEED
ncbi:hypothetical protein [Streptomyces sp. NPDC049906]|uniref:hypothetical protein n=1 Tax=Streptomyces sp. NPDC049906 TaxID=3155656 RepID=UPI00342B21AC